MTTTDRTDAPDAAFQQRLAAIDAAHHDESSAVERVARAIWETEHSAPWSAAAGWQERKYRRYARAALAAMSGPVSDAEAVFECGVRMCSEAAKVRRVEALAEEWEAAGDARYSQNRIAKETAARSLRAALRPAVVAGDGER